MRLSRTHTPAKHRSGAKVAALAAAALLAASSAGCAEVSQTLRGIDNAIAVALGGQPQGGDYGSGGEGDWEGVALCEDESADAHAYILSQKNANAAINLCEPIAGDAEGTFTPLTAVAAFGNAKDIKILLARGANINAPDPQGYTPLMSAVSGGWGHGKAENIQPLLANGADVNAAGAWGETALSLAKAKRANYCSANDAECRQAADNVIRMLQEAGAKENPIAEGAADANGNTALMLAARSGDTKEMQRLIAAGADVNAANQAGNTALLAAVHAGKTNAVKVLLNKGANVNAANGAGKTALMVASEICDIKGNERYCRADMVKLLLAQGANVHARDKKGKTAMEYADRMGYEGTGDKVRAALKSAAKKSSGKKRK